MKRLIAKIKWWLFKHKKIKPRDYNAVACGGCCPICKWFDLCWGDFNDTE